MIYKKIILEGKQKVWFTSDSHYAHKNICRGVSNWWDPNLPVEEQRGTYEDFLASTRDFKNLGHMNSTLVNSINKYVAEDDILFHLGDWSFGGIENIWIFRNQILCKNIIFIPGNHDEHIVANKKLPNEDLYNVPKGVAPFPVNAMDIFDSVHPYLEATISCPNRGKRTYNMMHFPLAVWNKSHHNRIMLHGHCHANFQHEGRSCDMGVDHAFKLFGEYRPFSEDDIDRFMAKRSFVQKDHHNKRVN